jgi:hypothetical protein
VTDILSLHLPEGSEIDVSVRIFSVQANIRNGSLQNIQVRNDTAGVKLLSNSIDTKQPHKTPFQQKLHSSLRAARESVQ